MKKAKLLLLTLPLMLSACDYSNAARADIKSTLEVADKLAENQKTPTDIEYSLERYNLIRRAYWVNGMKEKARSVNRPAEVPMGYCVLFSAMGQVLGQFQVDGKVSSLNSYLTADYYVISGGYNIPLADVDGSFGENDLGIFFFTPQWQYIEWDGNYLYSDTPFKVSNTVLEDY